MSLELEDVNITQRRKPLLLREVPPHLRKFVLFESQQIKEFPNSGWRGLVVPIVCPVCSKVRVIPPSYIRRWTHLQKWTAQCHSCAVRGRNAGHSTGGPQNGNWKGGRSVYSDGTVIRHYASFTQAEQDILRPMFPKSRPRIAEHRAVIAIALGRPLDIGEHIYRINKNKQDNRLKNLRIVYTGLSIAKGRGLNEGANLVESCQ